MFTVGFHFELSLRKYHNRSIPIELSANGYKVNGQKYVELTWSGATTTNVDIYRNNTLYATTANDGADTTGSLGVGGSTDTFKICEEGTNICSNEAAVNW